MKLFLFRDDVVPESNDHMEHNLRIPGDPFTVPSSRSGFSRYCNIQLKGGWQGYLENDLKKKKKKQKQLQMKLQIYLHKNTKL